uniref:DNA replication complex GINS protein PSF3 n=1 Tax=Phlebotomus papatasi TaxID=29031 RepID=A0A1B0EZ33_PHLPP
MWLNVYPTPYAPSHSERTPHRCLHNWILFLAGNRDLSVAPFDVSLSGAASGSAEDSTATEGQGEGEQELPFWMLNDAEDLHNYYVKINVPEVYRSLNKSICEAGANSVDLGKLCKYFYEFGLHASKFDDHNIIGNMLLNTLRQRLPHISDLCNCVDVKNNRDNHFDSSEEKLYNTGCETFSMFHNWLTKDVGEARLRNNKRKRSLMEADDILKFLLLFFADLAEQQESETDENSNVEDFEVALSKSDSNFSDATEASSSEADFPSSNGSNDDCDEGRDEDIENLPGNSYSDSTTHSYSSLLLEDEDDLMQSFIKKESLDICNGNG